MALKFFGLVLVVATLGGVAKAETDAAFYTISRMRVEEISTDVLGMEQSITIQSKSFSRKDIKASQQNAADPVERAGKVITTARDLVALGEDVYRLVVKGRPTNTTKYAPISVVPKVNGAAVDLMETETWKMPVKRSYAIVYENTYGVDVVTYKYSVIYAYGGSYDGKGAYLTSVQIVPTYVRTLFGFDFTATMKLGGIQNQGTRANPVAGATLLMEYTVSSMMNAINKVDSFFVTGKGAFRKF